MQGADRYLVTGQMEPGSNSARAFSLLLVPDSLRVSGLSRSRADELLPHRGRSAACGTKASCLYLLRRRLGPAQLTGQEVVASRGTA